MLKTLQLPAAGWYVAPATGELLYTDGKAWYVYSQGLFYPMGFTSVTPPKVVALTIGNTLRISYQYSYKGPALSVTEYAGIGIWSNGQMDSMMYSQKNRSLPESSTPIVYSGTQDVVVPDNAQETWKDIYIYILYGTGSIGVVLPGAITISLPVPTFTELKIVDYAKA